ncbi:hypothetical protein PHET_08717 [Paragonimus heterotremus]|uniref:Uncharacterized protein n=1 Tax=Paragonimus heterotremus TaxID=100268 RepID=A0A8J4WFB7_9TREM|nr:hypothetical protein PHET_08717 [Paragonimus heterotremus]
MPSSQLRTRSTTLLNGCKLSVMMLATADNQPYRQQSSVSYQTQTESTETLDIRPQSYKKTSLNSQRKHKEYENFDERYVFADH